MDSLSPAAREALTTRLEELLAQRVAVFAESTVTGGTGDAADRAGNVDAIIRLEGLDARIAALHEQLTAPASTGTDSGTAHVGSRVVVRFGADEAPETFLIGPLEQAVGDVDVITPASPLGKALLGVGPGTEVSYRSTVGTTVSATLVDILS
ncbi:MAG: GreA/GreB family elongation factor [Frankiales bacterium]|jgi:transcription elongation factor GreA|nr:GreA/GreB family elongation factor [Frankiales bacterium]